MELKDKTLNEVRALLDNLQGLLATHEQLVRDGQFDALGVLTPPTLLQLSNKIDEAEAILSKIPMPSHTNVAIE